MQALGQKQESGSKFVVEGKYPKERNVEWKSTLVGRATPEKYRDMYHKECYFRKRGGEPTRRNHKPQSWRFFASLHASEDGPTPSSTSNSS